MSEVSSHSKSLQVSICLSGCEFSVQYAKLSVEVPFLCKLPVDQISFNDFHPQQNVIDLRVQLSEEVARFLQTWLYFGLRLELLTSQLFEAVRPCLDTI